MEEEGVRRAEAIIASQSDEYMKDAVSRMEKALEKVLSDQEGSSSVVEDLSKKLKEISFSYQDDLEQLKIFLEERLQELNEAISELQDRIVPREYFTDLASKVDSLHGMKADRDDLGRLLEVDFVDGLLEEQSNLRFDIEELKYGLLTTKTVDEEISKDDGDSLEEIRQTIAKMEEKLDLEDIQDSLARLEEQTDTALEELQILKNEKDDFEREAKSFFSKYTDIFASLQRLEVFKVDKSKLNESLQLKADAEMVSKKLDSSEFVSVIRHLEENHSTLAVMLRIHEEATRSGLREARHELSLKMYSEDLVTALEPLRHRLQAIVCEQRRMKDMLQSHLLPHAPGVLKCFSCNREAYLVGLKNKDSFRRNSEELINKEMLKFPPIEQ